MTRIVLAVALSLAAALGLLLGLAAGGRPSSPALGAAAGPPSFAEIAERVNPSVVNVTVIEDRLPAGHPALDSEALPGVPRRGEGSGFIVDPAGYILTNHHVVASPDRIRVRLADKRELPATLVGSDPSTDLALLKVSATGLPALALGDSDRLRVGEWVCAIGNPYRFDHSVTVGVVSSKGRKIYDPSFDAYIQTDAAINPGNSGGPLVNASGEAVGISSAVSLQGQGIGFAVPSNVAKDVLQQLRSRGHVSRGYLGIQLQEMDADLARMLGVAKASGAMILDVVEGNAGEAAGLKRYDVITSVSGTAIEDGDHLVRVIASQAPGSEVALEVVRDRRPITLTARLAERGAASERPPLGEPARVNTPGAGDRLGLVVEDVTPQMREDLRLPPDRQGVAVTSVVGLSGLEQLVHGDLVLEVNRQPTPDLASYRKAVGALKPGDVAWLFVQRPRPSGTFLAR
ncbi:MAG TPA: trypsin-like peptidase domain-containing protein, partial [Vicinamibacteria bacterium]|nr:trypsin-like peptidase domain-containing protein [Vicinamibacteria bacterium]